MADRDGNVLLPTRKVGDGVAVGAVGHFKLPDDLSGLLVEGAKLWRVVYIHCVTARALAVEVECLRCQGTAAAHVARTPRSERVKVEVFDVGMPTGSVAMGHLPQVFARV